VAAVVWYRSGWRAPPSLLAVGPPRRLGGAALAAGGGAGMKSTRRSPAEAERGRLYQNNLV